MVELNVSSIWDVEPLEDLSIWGEKHIRLKHQESFAKGWLKRPNFVINGTDLEIGECSFILDNAVLRFKADPDPISVDLSSVAVGQYAVITVSYLHTAPFITPLFTAPVFAAVNKIPSELIAFDLAAYEATNENNLVVCVVQRKLDGTFHNDAVQGQVFNWSKYAVDRDYKEFDIIARFMPDGVDSESFNTGSQPVPANREFWISDGFAITGMEYITRSVSLTVYITSDGSSSNYTAVGISLKSGAFVYYDTGQISIANLPGFDAPNNVKDILYIEPMVTVTDPADIQGTNLLDARRIIKTSLGDNAAVFVIDRPIDPSLFVLDPVYFNIGNSRYEKASSSNDPIGILVEKNDVGYGQIVFFGEKQSLPSIGFTGPVYMTPAGALTNSVTDVRIGFAKTVNILMVDIDSGVSGFILRNQTIAGGLSITDPVYWTGAQWDKASSTNLPLGILTGTTEVTLGGLKDSLSGLTPGFVYMEEDGSLSSTVTDVKLGFAISASVLLVDIDINLLYRTSLSFDDTYVELSGDRFNLVSLVDKVLSFDAWVALSALTNQDRNDVPGGAGTINSALVFGGVDTAVILDTTEKFNGDAWESGSWDMNTVKKWVGSTGIQNAAMVIKGNDAGTRNDAEIFNGNSWSVTSGLSTSDDKGSGFGRKSATVFQGGNISTVLTETFDGSSWSVSGSANTGRWYHGAAGVQNAGLIFGGNGPITSTEKFNGSIWIAVANMGTARHLNTGAGVQNAALTTGSSPAGTDVEVFNGYLWRYVASQGSNVNAHGAAGSQNANMIFGGSLNDGSRRYYGLLPYYFYVLIKGTDKNFHELIEEGHMSFKDSESFDCALEIRSKDNLGLDGIERSDLLDLGRVGIGAGAWTASGGLNTADERHAAAGFQKSALKFGGNVGHIQSEKFNGSIWSIAAAMEQRTALAGCGIQNSALSFGGFKATYSAVTQKFDGTAWSASGNLNTARMALGGAGVQNAALSFGGLNGPASGLNVTEEFNGTSWSVTGNLNVSRWRLAGAGVQNSVLSFGGEASTVDLDTTEKFNGILWSITGSLLLARPKVNGAGTSADGLSVAGFPSGSSVDNTERFRSNIWIASEPLNVRRSESAATGTGSFAVHCGGIIAAGAVTNTEKFSSVLALPYVGMEVAKVY